VSTPQPITILPAGALDTVVDSIQLAHHVSDKATAISVTPAGLPGLLLHLCDGREALDKITTHSGRESSPAPCFLFGPGIEPSVMSFKSGACTTLHIVFKPHALKTLFGLNASALTNGWVAMDELHAGYLTTQLVEATCDQARIELIMRFLMSRLEQERARDVLVEECLRVIEDNPGELKMRDLLTTFSISERQLERRFAEVVGLSPHTYIRVRRFNAALRLMRAQRYVRLTDVAAALKFADQSHFNREVKAFSGMTPGSLITQVATQRPDTVE
jgi:AraC-like DNA-binding protein